MRAASGNRRDRTRTATRVLALVCVVLITIGSVGVLDRPTDPRLAANEERPAANTLVGLQGYHEEGRAIELAPNGSVVWEYRGFDDVFDVEALDANTVQVAGASTVADSECPPRYRDDGTRGCVRNAVRIIDQRTNETRWRYGWYDVARHEHELHDVDRYRAGGEYRWAFVDMGNDRAFAIDRSGTIQWQWNANETYDRPAEMGPEGDWTHVNDIDRVGRGTFQVSLRNFDSVVSLGVRANGSVTVEPVVGPNRYNASATNRTLYEQHNPDRLAEGHLLVADSEHDRVVELDSEGNVVWQAGGSDRFDWPRDADRQPNGHTVVADSYNDRVVELDSEGNVVWAVETGALPYDVDRLNENEAGEGSSDRPTATDGDLRSRIESASPIVAVIRYGWTLLKYAVPGWLSPYLLGAGMLAGVGAVIGAYREQR